jgi:AraC-like DNA-binding protein
LNFYRIADAKAALADPAQAAVPVLTIALDSGFSSLGPFNRAFKAETGMTPTEFRRLGGANPGNDRPIPDSASAFPNSASRISPAP